MVKIFSKAQVNPVQPMKIIEAHLNVLVISQKVINFLLNKTWVLEIHKVFLIYHMRWLGNANESDLTLNKKNINVISISHEINKK